MPRIAINGFGRIGRNTLKAGLKKPGFNVVAVNDLTDPKTLAHLFKYDTVYGRYPGKVSAGKDFIKIDGKKIAVYSEKDPSKLPWADLKIDVVIESTGFFRTKEAASAHVKAGAKRVIISAPSKGGDVPTHVIGVNQNKLKKSSKVIDNASCTTNCIAPVIAILNNKWGIQKAMMTTIHGYTSTQKLVDGPHKDLRRARAAAQNIVPTTTGAAIATTEAIPKLKGKFDGISVRVPILVGSLSDFVILLKKKTTAEAINKHFKELAKHPFYKGVLAVTNDPIVSSDVIGSSYSTIVDMSMTAVLDGDFVKILAWYDNEWGYSHRLAELAIQAGKQVV